MLAGIGETAIPRLIGGLRDRTQPYRSRSIAARALAELSYAQFASQLDRLVKEELHDTRRLLAGARVLEKESAEHASLGLLARAQRERVGASVDFALELLAIGGLLPNFDLLIVSLHSANAKVRGNAIESIESGVSNSLFRLLEPLLGPQGGNTAMDEAEDIGDTATVLDGALSSGQPIEMAAAADVLHERLDPAGFTARIQPVIEPDMPAFLRGHLLALLGLNATSGFRPFDILVGLSRHAELGGATLEALMALADRAQAEKPTEDAIIGTADGMPFWVPQKALADVASRYPDLALVILKTQDGRQYAA